MKQIVMEEVPQVIQYNDERLLQQNTFITYRNHENTIFLLMRRPGGYVFASLGDHLARGNNGVFGTQTEAIVQALGQGKNLVFLEDIKELAEWLYK